MGSWVTIGLRVVSLTMIPKRKQMLRVTTCGDAGPLGSCCDYGCGGVVADLGL